MYQEILSMKTIEDFPKIMHKPYIVGALDFIENQIKQLKISYYRANGAYKDYITNELRKYDEFKKFLMLKLQEIADKEFERIISNKPKKEVKQEVKQEIKAEEKEEIEEKPKKRSYRRKFKKSEENENE